MLEKKEKFASLILLYMLRHQSVFGFVGPLSPLHSVTVSLLSSRCSVYFKAMDFSIIEAGHLGFN